MLRAKIDDAKAALKSLRDGLDETADKARDTDRELDKLSGDGGLKTRGNAIADLTGPLGEASGAASDFAGVFDGLGDIAEDVAGKVGLNAEAMGAAIGGVGIAVAGAAALWGYFSQKQAEARRKQEELVKGQKEFNDALREGDTAGAAAKFVELYKGAIDAADDLGASQRQVIDYITGQSKELDPLIERWDNYATKQGAAADTIQSAKDNYLAANDTLDAQARLLRDVEQALSTSRSETDRAAAAQIRHERALTNTRDALDRVRGGLSMEGALLSFQSAMTTAFDHIQEGAGASQEDILAIKQSILDVAEYANLTPVQVQTLLTKVSNGDLVGVKADVERYYANNKVDVGTQLRDPSSYDVNEFRRRMQAAVGTVYIDTELRGPRSGAMSAS